MAARAARAPRARARRLLAGGALALLAGLRQAPNLIAAGALRRGAGLRPLLPAARGACARRCKGFNMETMTDWDEVMEAIVEDSEAAVTTLNFDPRSPLDAEDRQNPLVGFGKHRNLTYKDAWDLHPKYCTGFVLHSYNQSESKPKIRAFGEWLLEQGAEPTEAYETFDDDSVVGFGPLENMTFREAWKKDHLYCEIIARAYGEFYRRTPECNFAWWLQMKGVDAEARPPRRDDILGFGKLEGKTFKEALSEDMDYCRYIVRCADGETEEMNMLSLERFAKWLKKQGVVGEEPAGPDCHVGFGKLSDQTYQEVMTQHRDYCESFIMVEYGKGKKSDEEGVESGTGPLLMKLGKWLEEQGVEASANEYEARAQAAVSSGKSKNEEYEQILAQRPEYCESILKLSDDRREEVRTEAKAFAD